MFNYGQTTEQIRISERIFYRTFTPKHVLFAGVLFYGFITGKIRTIYFNDSAPISAHLPPSLPIIQKHVQSERLIFEKTPNLLSSGLHQSSAFISQVYDGVCGTLSIEPSTSLRAFFLGIWLIPRWIPLWVSPFDT